MREVHTVFDTSKLVSGEVFKVYTEVNGLAYLLKLACLSAVKHSVGNEAAAIFRVRYRRYSEWALTANRICCNGCEKHPIV